MQDIYMQDKIFSNLY